MRSDELLLWPEVVRLHLPNQPVNAPVQLEGNMPQHRAFCEFRGPAGNQGDTGSVFVKLQSHLGSVYLYKMWKSMALFHIFSHN